MNDRITYKLPYLHAHFNIESDCSFCVCVFLNVSSSRRVVAVTLWHSLAYRYTTLVVPLFHMTVFPLYASLCPNVCFV